MLSQLAERILTLTASFSQLTQKHDGVASTGINTQGLDLRISGNNFSDGRGEAGSSIDPVYFHTHMEVYCELRAGPVTLLT